MLSGNGSKSGWVLLLDRRDQKYACSFVMQKEFADWSSLDDLVREVLMKRCNILRDTSELGYDKGDSRQDLDAARYLVLHRISVRRDVTSAAGYKYYGPCHHRM